jgi:hypothetical protein
MFEATPQRRKAVVIVLLALAVVGGAIRHWASNPSTLRDLGSLLLVLWVPPGQPAGGAGTGAAAACMKVPLPWPTRGCGGG